MSKASSDPGRTRLHRAVDAARIGIWHCNLPFAQLEWNAHCKAHFGLPPDAVVCFDDFVSLLHPDDRQPTLQAIQDALDHGLPCDVVYRTHGPDGEIRWIRFVGRAYCDQLGGQARFDGVTMEVGEQGRAAQGLRDDWQRLRAALEASGTGTYRFDVATGRVDCDANLLAILGLDVDEAPADLQAWLEMVHPDDRETAMLAKRDCLEHGTVLDLQLRVMRHDGSVRWVQDKGRRLLDDLGAPLALTGACVDVTASKRADDALRDVETRFLQVQKLEAIGRMAGGIAHDFNSLLTAVTGYAELGLALAEEGMQPGMAQSTAQVSECLDEILRAGVRASALTAQLLAYSRKQVMALQVLNLDAVVANAAPMLTDLLEDRCELVMQLADASAQVRVDPAQIRVALVQLVRNARDAMPAGGQVTVTTGHAETVQPLVPVTFGHVERQAEIAPGRYAVLSVRDTGHGMDDGVKAHLFEPFFTTKDQGQGTGLGLATVYGIVRQSEGHVQVFSEPGRGTEVRVFLPVV